jgi:hypothetical protein
VTTLFPRLSSADVCQHMSRYAGWDVARIAIDADAGLDALNVTYAATGGARIERARLQDLRTTVRTIASRSGYPEDPDLEGQQRFDRETMLYLRTVPGLDAGEAIRAETWQFVAGGLLPDIVFWRWADAKGLKEYRYLGGNRNCFGRLWQRAVVFWDERLADPETVLKLLKEDNFVAILERSAFAAFALPCREVARAFLLRRHLAKDEKGRSLEEEFLRDAMRRMVRITGYSSLWALDVSELRGLVARVFDAALKAKGITAVSEVDLERRQRSLALSDHS